MPSSRPKDAVTFRISKLLALQLRLPPYKENKAILIRLLLDAYFADLLPGIRRKFEEEVSKKTLTIQNGGNSKTQSKLDAKEVILTWMEKRKKLQKQQNQQLNQNQLSKPK